MIKTISFALIHFSIATLVAFSLTGDFLLGSLVALVEPSVNTVAFYFHEKAWIKVDVLRSVTTIKAKTVSFAVIHFTVAFSVAYLLTGDAFIGGLIAVIEPSLNAIAYLFHEKAWVSRRGLEFSH